MSREALTNNKDDSPLLRGCFMNPDNPDSFEKFGGLRLRRKGLVLRKA